MPCAETLNTQAFLDGETDGAGAEATGRHIQGCAECQALCAETAAVSDAIARHLPREPAPPHLRRRVEVALAREREVARRRGFIALPGAVFWRGAVSGAAATALAASLAIFVLGPPSADSLADQVTQAHVRALMSGHAIAVVSSDHHTVKPWFAGRVPLSPPVADFEGQGFKLIGGRLDRVGGAPAAVVVYQHGKHEIDLFVWAARGVTPPTAAVRRGYHALLWKRNDLDFAAVSDTDATELAKFSDLVRAEPE
jgi:anti-sigma factor RsiW